MTGLSCDCAGFIAHQRCSHHSLLLERLGWLPELLEDEAALAATVPCFACNGCGRVPDNHIGGYTLCDRCNGTGRRPDHRLAGRPSVEVVATAA